MRRLLVLTSDTPSSTRASCASRNESIAAHDVEPFRPSPRDAWALGLPLTHVQHTHLTLYQCCMSLCRTTALHASLCVRDKSCVCRPSILRRGDHGRARPALGWCLTFQASHSLHVPALCLDLSPPSLPPSFFLPPVTSSTSPVALILPPRRLSLSNDVASPSIPPSPSAGWGPLS